LNSWSTRQAEQLVKEEEEDARRRVRVATLGGEQQESDGVRGTTSGSGKKKQRKLEALLEDIL